MTDFMIVISITIVATGFDQDKQVEGMPDENRNKRVVHRLNDEVKATAVPTPAPLPEPAPAKELPEEQPVLSEKPRLFRPTLRNLRNPEDKPKIVITETPKEEEPTMQSDLQEPTLKSELEQLIIRHELTDDTAEDLIEETPIERSTTLMSRF